MRRDTPIFGFMIGLLLPFIGMVIMYLLWGHGQGFGSFLHSLTRLKGMASKVLTLSILINVIPFAYCNIKRIDMTARGIFVATMLYALLIVLIMFVW